MFLLSTREIKFIFQAPYASPKKKVNEQDKQIGQIRKSLAGVFEQHKSSTARKSISTGSSPVTDSYTIRPAHTLYMIFSRYFAQHSA